MVEALASLEEYRSTGRTSIEDVEEVIVAELLPSLNITESTRISLKKYWSDLTPKQQLILKTYIATSLVDNYSSVLHSYEDLSSIKISVDPKVKRKDNKAIVKMYIAEQGKNKPIAIVLKMILTGDDWHIYDVVLSGVSLVKNYKATFNSLVKRKGISGLITKATKKLRKHSKENCPVCLSMGLQQAVLDAEIKF
jgi:phospholipid transport system substrate-binding protein